MADGQSFFAVVTLLAPLPGGGGAPPSVWPQPPTGGVPGYPSGQPVPPGYVSGQPVPPPTTPSHPIELPGAPPSAPGSPTNPIVLPPVMWPPQPGVPSHPIVVPPDQIPGGGVSLPIYPPLKPDQGLPVVPPAGAYILVWVVGTSTFKLVYIPATVNPQPPTATPTR